MPFKYPLTPNRATAKATQKAALAMTAPGLPDPTTLCDNNKSSCPPAAKTPCEVCCAASACLEELDADSATAARIAALTARLPMEYLRAVRTLCIV